jgi:DNA adenine methylase
VARTTAADETTGAPFLRWAGGKRWLLPQIPALLKGVEVNNYYEPFLGGASVFFGIQPTGTAYLSDLNHDLIETYIQVRDHPTRVSTLLNEHVNEQEYYYSIRANRPSARSERAARFIYLNHTSFNGIYRVNLQGDYNVPFGGRASPAFPTKAELHAVSERLKGAWLTQSDFEPALRTVEEGDLVFLDPPYTIAHNHNGFIKYNQRLFSFEDQIRLRKAVETIRERGAHYILTNAAHKSIAELFDMDDRRIETTRRNVIGGREAARGQATEYLFTNLQGT